MDAPDFTTLKRCSKCGEWKSHNQFYADRSKNDGLGSQCKSCTRERKRHWNIENPERVRDSSSRYRELHAEQIREYSRRYRAENAEKARESVRRWHRENQEAARESRLRYRENNPDRVRESARRWARENPETVRTNYHRRRAREYAAGGMCTPADLTAIRAAQTDKRGRLICWRCGKPITDTPHLDHWIPLKHRGPNSAGNLHYMHAKCNLEKSDKLPQEIGRLL